MSSVYEGIPSTLAEFEAGTFQGRTRKLVQWAIRQGVIPVGGLRLVGHDRIPRSGPLIYVSNHLHNLDPLLEIAAFPRPIHFMAKKEVFESPVMGWWATKSGGFAVDRGKGDRTAIKWAENALDLGLPIGIFPEGTRSLTKALQPAQAGAGFIALRSGVPVLPSAITGTERLPGNGSKGKLVADVPNPDPLHGGVRIVYGDPFTIPKEIDGRRVTSDEATEIMMVEIARLLPPAYRGVYKEALEQETVRRAVPWTPAGR